MTRPRPRSDKREALRARGSLHPRADQVKDPAFSAGGFFDPHDLVQVKYEMLRRVRSDGQSVAEASRNFGLSRPTVYQAQAAFAREGIVGLLPGKRGPRGAHKLRKLVLDFVRKQVEGDAGIDMSALAKRVRERFGLTVHPRSIERALARAEKKTP